MKRAIWSAPPPVPAGTTNSTDFVGSHAAKDADAPTMAKQAATARTSLEKFIATLLWLTQKKQRRIVLFF
jgi:hypothetical protein